MQAKDVAGGQVWSPLAMGYADQEVLRKSPFLVFVQTASLIPCASP